MYLTLKTAFWFAWFESLRCWSTRGMFQLFRKNGFGTHVQSQRHSSPPLSRGFGAFLKPQPGKSSSSAIAFTTTEIRAKQTSNILRWSNQLAKVNLRSAFYGWLPLQHLVMVVCLIKTQNWGKVYRDKQPPDFFCHCPLPVYTKTVVHTSWLAVYCRISPKWKFMAKADVALTRQSTSSVDLYNETLYIHLTCFNWKTAPLWNIVFVSNIPIFPSHMFGGPLSSEGEGRRATY